MGIKEFIKQTAENQPDNIRNVRIEIKNGKELPFDPETEISESDWEMMMAKVKSYHNDKRWVNFIVMMMPMIVLRHECGRGFNISEEEWQEIKADLLDSYRKKRMWWKFTGRVMTLRTIKPQLALDIDYPSREGKEIMEELETYRDNGEHDENCWRDFAILAMRIKIIWPEQAVDFNIDKTACEGIKKALEKFRYESDWVKFAELLMAVKVISPKLYKELKIGEKEWKAMKENWKSCRDEMNDIISDNFPWRAMVLKILAAHEVEVTNDGLKITMRDPAEEYREQKEPMPVRRTF